MDRSEQLKLALEALDRLYPDSGYAFIVAGSASDQGGVFTNLPKPALRAVMERIAAQLRAEENLPIGRRQNLLQAIFAAAGANIIRSFRKTLPWQNRS